MKIMIVDDSRMMRGIVRRTLRMAGFKRHEFREASNGIEALACLVDDAPDLVLADWNMPGMSGLSLLEELRARGLQVKFGFVTAEGTPEMIDAAIEAGALFLISKPFTPENFRSALQEVFA